VVRAGARLARPLRGDRPIGAFADLVGFAAASPRRTGRIGRATPWRPHRINLGSGKDYKAGWLNLDVLDAPSPTWCSTWAAT
jgi:hypothetical protein